MSRGKKTSEIFQEYLSMGFLDIQGGANLLRKIEASGGGTCARCKADLVVDLFGNGGNWDRESFKKGLSLCKECEAKLTVDKPLQGVYSQPTDKMCRVCGVHLTPTNHLKTCQDRGDRICRDCKSKENTKYTKKWKESMKPRETCRVCKDPLNAVNWYPSFQRTRQLICVSCFKESRGRPVKENVPLKVKEAPAIPQGYKCAQCSVELTKENWGESNRKAHKYYCKPCECTQVKFNNFKRKNKLGEKKCRKCDVVLTWKNTYLSMYRNKQFTCKTCQVKMNKNNKCGVSNRDPNYVSPKQGVETKLHCVVCSLPLRETTAVEYKGETLCRACFDKAQVRCDICNGTMRYTSRTYLGDSLVGGRPVYGCPNCAERIKENTKARKHPEGRDVENPKRITVKRVPVKSVFEDIEAIRGDSEVYLTPQAACEGESELYVEINVELV